MGRRKQRSKKDSATVAHCCTIFLKSYGYRHIDDRHRNPNINIREIIWLGNQLYWALPWRGEGRCIGRMLPLSSLLFDLLNVVRNGTGHRNMFCHFFFERKPSYNFSKCDVVEYLRYYWPLWFSNCICKSYLVFPLYSTVCSLIVAEVGDRRSQGHNPILINAQSIVCKQKGTFSSETCQFSRFVANLKRCTRKSANFCHPVFVSRCSPNFINDSFLWKESLLTFYIMTCIQSFWKGVWRFIRKTSLALK